MPHREGRSTQEQRRFETRSHVTMMDLRNSNVNPARPQVEYCSASIPASPAIESKTGQASFAEISAAGK